MAVPIPVPLIPDVTGAATDVQGRGPDHVPGLTSTAVLARHALLCPIEEEAGILPKLPDPTDLDRDPAPLAATGTAALVEESPLLAS